MRKLLCSVWLAAATFLGAQAQQSVNQMSDGGTPWGSKFKELDAQLPFERMPLFDLGALQAQDELNKNNKNIPYRFGYTHFVDISPANSGQWTTLENGDRVWRMGIQSPNAITLNLAFEKLVLPQGTKLFVYTVDRSTVLGAFTQKHVSVDGMLGTELLKGDRVIIELYEPKTVQGQSQLKLSSVVHGYRDLNGYIAKSFGDAGNCMNNVNCPAYAAYDDQKRSVVCLVNGGEFCTGALINNTCNDGTPYVLTANHCGSSGFGSWVFRFNWEAAGCTDPGSSPSTAQSVSGGTQRAASAGSDMSLVQINSAVPSAYNPFFAGWDRNDVPASNTYGIHHPSGDIKKISFTTGNTVGAPFGGATCWKTGTWTDGVTEPGSSGSPLFNQAGQIVGQLYGGPSDCSQEGNATNGVDYYGKLFTSWTGGGTNATRLSNWLAPAGCGTAPGTLDGYDPNAVTLALDAQLLGVAEPVAGTTCNTSFTPQVTFKNKGTTTLTSASIKYRVDNGSEVTYNWSGSLATDATANLTLANFTAAAGNHTFKVYVSAPNGGTDQNNLNDTSVVAFTILTPSGNALPFSQGFENATFPPANWTLENAGGPTWVRTTTAASQGTASARKNNLDDSDVGALDNLITPYLDFSSTAAVSMTFKVAYARFNATYYDSLIVWATGDCGQTWTRVYNKGNSTLATAPDLSNNSAFVPTAAQWRLETVDLSAFAGNDQVRLNFQNKCGYGQYLYIDDINIIGGNSAPTAGFNISDNTPCAGQSVTLTNTSVGATSYAWNIPGGTPNTSTDTNPTVVFNTAGSYTVTLTATNANGSQNSQQNITVNAVPATPTASSNSPVTAGNPINLSTPAVAGASYYWTGPGGFTSTQQNPTVIGGAAGQYCVYLIANGCTSQTGCTTVVVSGPSSISENEAFTVALFPNPTSGTVQVQVAADGLGTRVKVTDMTGKTIRQQTVYTDTHFMLDFSPYAKGVYFITLENEKGTVIRKIVKQ